MPLITLETKFIVTQLLLQFQQFDIQPYSTNNYNAANLFPSASCEELEGSLESLLLSDTARALYG